MALTVVAPAPQAGAAHSVSSRRPPSACCAPARAPAPTARAASPPARPLKHESREPATLPRPPGPDATRVTLLLVARVHRNASRSGRAPLRPCSAGSFAVHYPTMRAARSPGSGTQSRATGRRTLAVIGRPSVAGFHRRMSILCTNAHLLAVATGASRRSRPSEGGAAELMALGSTASPLARSHGGNSHIAHLREMEGGP